MEIKFVDRMLALQRLYELLSSPDDPQTAILPLYDALRSLSKDPSA